MEMTVRYAKNADADVDASYLRNLPLIKLLQQEPVNTEDWCFFLQHPMEKTSCFGALVMLEPFALLTQRILITGLSTV